MKFDWHQKLHSPWDEKKGQPSPSVQENCYQVSKTTAKTCLQTRYHPTAEDLVPSPSFLVEVLWFSCSLLPLYISLAFLCGNVFLLGFITISLCFILCSCILHSLCIFVITRALYSTSFPSAYCHIHGD